MSELRLSNKTKPLISSIMSKIAMFRRYQFIVKLFVFFFFFFCEVHHHQVSSYLYYRHWDSLMLPRNLNLRQQKMSSIEYPHRIKMSSIHSIFCCFTKRNKIHDPLSFFSHKFQYRYSPTQSMTCKLQFCFVFFLCIVNKTIHIDGWYENLSEVNQS